MSSEFSICMLSWNGNWKTIRDKTTYIGGESKLFRIPNGTHFENLKDTIYKTLSVDAKEYDLQISMQSSYGLNKILGRLARIEDDDELMCFVDYCRMNPSYVITLYASFELRVQDQGKAKRKSKTQEQRQMPPPKLVSLQSCVVPRPKPNNSVSVENIPGLDDLTENQIDDDGYHGNDGYYDDHYYFNDGYDIDDVMLIIMMMMMMMMKRYIKLHFYN